MCTLIWASNIYKNYLEVAEISFAKSSKHVRKQ